MSGAAAATLVTAIFAALAAGASWASVLQTRRERIAAQTPDLHIEVMQTISRSSPSRIRVQIINSGGLAKRVKFAVVQGSQLAYGHPPPTPTFLSGESRVIETSLSADKAKEVVAYVACFDARAKNFYFWHGLAEKRVYRVADLDRTFNDDKLMRELLPDFDINAVKMVGYETVERTT